MATKLITDEQWDLLRRYGCKIKPYSITKVSAGRLISYIKHGNGTVGNSPRERAAITKSFREKYVGKKVRCIGQHVDEGRVGVVTDIRARLVDEVNEVGKNRITYGADPENLNICPFVCCVTWEATDTLKSKVVPFIKGVSVFFLELIDKEQETESDVSYV